jgi:cytochrome P450
MAPECSVMLNADSEMTRTSLSNLVYLLAMHARVAEKLRVEAGQALGDIPDAGVAPFESVRHGPLIHATRSIGDHGPLDRERHPSSMPDI